MSSRNWFKRIKKLFIVNKKLLFSEKTLVSARIDYAIKNFLW